MPFAIALYSLLEAGGIEALTFGSNEEDRIGSLQLPQPLIVDERACDRLPPPAFLDVPLAQLDRVRQVLIKLMFREMLEKS